jgi:hypothetical protein
LGCRLLCVATLPSSIAVTFVTFIDNSSETGSSDGSDVEVGRGD